MRIDLFLSGGLAGHPFPEIERLKRLLDAADPMAKLRLTLPDLQGAMGGLVESNLSATRRAFPEAGSIFGIAHPSIDALRLVVADGDHWTAVTDAAGGRALAAFRDSFGLPDIMALSEIGSEFHKEHALLANPLSGIRGTAYYDSALRSAGLAANLALPGYLDAYRLGTDAFADRLAVGGLVGAMAPGQWSDPGFLSAFGAAAAMASAMATGSAINSDVMNLVTSLAAAGIPSNLGLRDYRGVLDSAGLVLPRWPTIRVLSPKEQAERQAGRMRKHRQPPHVGKAKSLVHQHERYLREVIDELMNAQYGDEWPDERLTVCAKDPDCRRYAQKLLSVWRRDGGNVLDHADYVHYRMIMVQEDHFGEIFSFGFGQDPQVITDLIAKARQLRAASHHARSDFTPQDLQDLRVTWGAISLGLRELTTGMEISFGED
jgi:hypothetical protein